MKTNKAISFALLNFLLISTLTSCGEQPKQDHYAKEVEFNNIARETKETLELDFFESNPYVVYTTIEKFMEKLVPPTFDIKKVNDTYVFTNTINNSNAVINLSTSRITYDSYALFNSDSNWPHDESKPYMYKYELIEEESSFVKGIEYSIKLSDYNLAPKKDGDTYYFPIELLCTISPFYPGNAVLFDGNDKVYFVSAGDSDFEIPFTPEYPKSFFEYTYDLFTFDIDLHFGLRDYSRPFRSTGKDHVYLQGGARTAFEKYRNDLVNAKTIKEYDQKFAEMFANELDDGGHSVIYYGSFLDPERKNNRYKHLGPEYEFTYSRLKSQGSARSNAISDNKDYDMFATFDTDGVDGDDIAYIYFTSFSTSDEDIEDMENILSSENGANARFNPRVNPNSKIKDIVIDISNNGGGSTEAESALRSWICGGTSTQVLRDARDGSVSTVTYRCDINGDGIFNELDYLPNDINVYILTDFSFSAAAALVYDTYMFNVAHANDGRKTNIKYIGFPCEGGACSLTGNALTPTGIRYRLSSEAVGVNWFDYTKNADELVPIEPGFELTSEQICDRIGTLNPLIVAAR